MQALFKIGSLLFLLYCLAPFTGCADKYALQGANTSKESRKDVSAYYMKGLDLWSNNNNLEGAIKIWKEEIKYGAVHPSWTHYVIGIAYSELKQYSKAIPYFKKAIALGYHHPDYAYQDLAQAYYNLNDIKRSENALLEALKISPYDKSILNSSRSFKGFTRITKKNIQRFQKEYLKKKEAERIANQRNAPALQKKLSEARKERIKKIDEEQKKMEKVDEEPFYIAYFKEIIMLSILFIALVFIAFRLWYPLYIFAGNGHFNAGRYEEAAEFYEKLLSIRSGKYVPFTKLKEIYLKTGRRDEKAIRVFEKIYKENPDDKDVITALANAYAEKVL